jgi:hypothetical protein
MAAGAKPALDPNVTDQASSTEASAQKPVTILEKIVHRLTQIFEYNERLGPTRQ